MTLEEVIRLVKDTREQFEHEQDQGLMQRDLHKAEMALAGKYACDRILRSIESRTGLRIVEPHEMSRAR